MKYLITAMKVIDLEVEADSEQEALEKAELLPEAEGYNNFEVDELLTEGY